MQTSDSLENMANQPAFQHGRSGGKAAPRGQGPAWPPTRAIISLASWGHEFVRTRLLALLR